MSEPTEPVITCDDRPRIEPGIYLGYSRTAKVYRDNGYKRWTCMVDFDVFQADGITVLAKVPFWLNLGMGQRAHAGRRGRFFQEWLKANGGPPKRGDRMSPRVFTHRMAKVAVGDVAGEAPYSVVREVLSWETGEVSKSLNQYSFNQVINIQPSTSSIKAGIPQEQQFQKLTSSDCQNSTSALARVEGSQPNSIPRAERGSSDLRSAKA